MCLDSCVGADRNWLNKIVFTPTHQYWYSLSHNSFFSFLNVLHLGCSMYSPHGQYFHSRDHFAQYEIQYLQGKILAPAAISHSSQVCVWVCVSSVSYNKRAEVAYNLYLFLRWVDLCSHSNYNAVHALQIALLWKPHWDHQDLPKNRKHSKTGVKRWEIKI